jgi:hypothetical protein
MDESTESVVVFNIKPDFEAGALVAWWDDPNGGGITTQADSLADLAAAIKEAVICHFSTGQAPRRAALRFADSELQLA